MKNMNLLSRSKLIRIISFAGLVVSFGAIYYTGDVFYLLFVIVSIIGLTSSCLNSKRNYNLKIPQTFKFKASTKLTNKFSSKFLLIYSGLAVLFFSVVILNPGLVASFNGFLTEKIPALEGYFDNSPEVLKDTVPTPIPTSTPYPTSPQPTRSYVDPDPIVNCGPGEHSGQYVKDRRSKCMEYVDCGLDNNTIWTMMTKSECDKKHLEQASKNNQVVNPPASNSSKVPVFMSYGGVTYYCPEQNVGAVMSINSTLESKKSSWSQNFSDCYKSYQQTDSCYVACKADSTTDYGDCISKCPDFVSQCNWAYSERDSLLSQVSNLCK